MLLGGVTLLAGVLLMLTLDTLFDDTQLLSEADELLAAGLGGKLLSADETFPLDVKLSTPVFTGIAVLGRP